MTYIWKRIQGFQSLNNSFPKMCHIIASILPVIKRVRSRPRTHHWLLCFARSCVCRLCHNICVCGCVRVLYVTIRHVMFLLFQNCELTTVTSDTIARTRSAASATRRHTPSATLPWWSYNTCSAAPLLTSSQLRTSSSNGRLRRFTDTKVSRRYFDYVMLMLWVKCSNCVTSLSSDIAFAVNVVVWPS